MTYYDGFIKDLEKKSYSATTIKSYDIVLGQFFSFLERLYSKNIEHYEIKSKDIRDYLSSQKKNEKAISTINKELAILKSFFNYLWEINKVPIDPAAKIKRLKSNNSLEINLFYEELLDIKQDVITHSMYSIKRKALFLLALKGLKASEFAIKKSDIIINSKDETAQIELTNRIVQLDEIDSSIFYEFYYSSLLSGSDYLFTSIETKDDSIVPITFMAIHHHLRRIQNDFSLKEKLQLTTIRRALCFYLYTKEKYSIQQIAFQMGVEEQTISIYVNKLLKMVNR